MAQPRTHAPAERPQVRPLNIFLAKPGIADVISTEHELSSFSVALGPERSGTLYFSQIPDRAPRWATLFAGQEGIDQLHNASAGAVLVADHAGRRFAITFGLARHFLKEEAFEDRFGLVTALNTVPRASMRRIDSLSLEGNGRVARVQLGTVGRFEEFGLDVDRDLMLAVTGRPSDARLGSLVSGKASLSVRVAVCLEGLPALLEACLSTFESTAYKREYGWIDYVKEVRDALVVERLESALIERFRNRDFDRMWMAVPEPIEWEKVDGFRYSRSESATHSDLSLPALWDSLRDPQSATVETIRGKRIEGVAPEGGASLYHWSAYACIYSEQDDGNSTYVLTNGNWYCLDRAFAAEVRQQIDELDGDCGIELPDWNDPEEKYYNERVAGLSNGELVCLDRRTIHHGGGQSQIEFCDLYSNRRHMIHVKKYAGSAVLSHLFQQGAVSANLFLVDEDFRTKANGLLPATLQRSQPGTRPDPTEYPVVFAITSTSNQRIIDSLPFFSKLSLRNAVRFLAGHGFPVHVVKIRDVYQPPPNSPAPRARQRGTRSRPSTG